MTNVSYEVKTNAGTKTVKTMARAKEITSLYGGSYKVIYTNAEDPTPEYMARHREKLAEVRNR